MGRLVPASGPVVVYPAVALLAAYATAWLSDYLQRMRTTLEERVLWNDR